jgi:hypothetical protein
MYTGRVDDKHVGLCSLFVGRLLCMPDAASVMDTCEVLGECKRSQEQRESEGNMWEDASEWSTCGDVGTGNVTDTETTRVGQ